MEYLRGKTQNHAAGSLEELVENLVKSWESEASHKVDMSQWKTVDRDAYQIQDQRRDPHRGRGGHEDGQLQRPHDRLPHLQVM